MAVGSGYHLHEPTANLLNCGYVINKKCKKELTGLHRAVWIGKKRKVKKLLKLGILHLGTKNSLALSKDKHQRLVFLDKDTLIHV